MFSASAGGLILGAWFIGVTAVLFLHVVRCCCSWFVSWECVLWSGRRCLMICRGSSVGSFFCWEMWPAFLGLSLLLTFRRSPAVVGVVRSLSLCSGLSARCLCGSVFCGCAGRGFNCYELTRVVNRLKHSGCVKNPDQSRGYELTNVAGMILPQKNWRAGPDADQKLSSIQSAAAIPYARAHEGPRPESWEEKTRRPEAGHGL